MKASHKKSVILFDGVCNLCNSSVQFILKNDKKKQFLFASLQSDAAKKLLLQKNHKNNNLNTIILIEGGEVYEKSTAALKITRRLGRIWSFFYIFIILPKSIRDFIYDFIAKNRYNWFGKKDNCIVPNEENKNRFI